MGVLNEFALAFTDQFNLVSGGVCLDVNFFSQRLQRRGTGTLTNGLLSVPDTKFADHKPNVLQKRLLQNFFFGHFIVFCILNLHVQNLIFPPCCEKCRSDAIVDGFQLYQKSR